jgi:hypothetical protein
VTDIDARVAETITRGLRTGLVHPGDGKDRPAVAIPIPAFRTASMPPEMAEHVDKTAGLIAEAIVHLIHQSGFDIQDAEAPRPVPPEGTVAVYCRCQKPLTRLTVSGQLSTVDGPSLAAELKAHTCHT